jgi:hypothetical protein
VKEDVSAIPDPSLHRSERTVKSRNYYVEEPTGDQHRAELREVTEEV